MTRDLIVGPLLVGRRPYRIWSVWRVKREHVTAYGCNLGRWTVSLSWGSS